MHLTKMLIIRQELQKDREVVNPPPFIFVFDREKL